MDRLWVKENTSSLIIQLPRVAPDNELNWNGVDEYGDQILVLAPVPLGFGLAIMALDLLFEVVSACIYPLQLAEL